jgi:hypothetical protein
MKRSRIARGSFFGILGVVGAWAWSACPPYPPLPLCTQYGGLIQAGVPICCEENAIRLAETGSRINILASNPRARSVT